MTREEALRKVNNILTDVFPTDYYHEVEELMEALEQETHDKCTETHSCVCEDAVSREQLKKCIIKVPIAPVMVGDDVVYRDVIFAESLDGLPPVQPIRKRGKWQMCGKDSRGYSDTFECSNCENIVRYAYYTKNCDYEFCPNCGCQMEEGE